MIEAIQVAGLDPASGAAGSAGAAHQPQAAAIEVRDFAQAQMRAGGAAQAAPTGGVEALPGASGVEQSQGAQLMMSAFDKLNGSANGIQELAQRLSTQTGDMTPSQMMELTMKSHEFMIQSQLTSNVANRTSDGVQQLFRQQS